MNDFSRFSAEGPHVRFANRIRMKYGAAGNGRTVIPLPPLVWLAAFGRAADGGDSHNVPIVVNQDARTFIYRFLTADGAPEGSLRGKRTESSGALIGYPPNAAIAHRRSFHERPAEKNGFPLNVRRTGAQEQSDASVWPGAAMGLTKPPAGTTGLGTSVRLRTVPVAADERPIDRHRLIPVSAGPLAGLSAAADFAARATKRSGTAPGTSRKDVFLLGKAGISDVAGGLGPGALPGAWLPSGIGAPLIANAAKGTGPPVPERFTAEDAIAMRRRPAPLRIQTGRNWSRTGAAAPELVVAQPKAAEADEPQSGTSERSSGTNPPAVRKRGPAAPPEEQTVQTPASLPQAEIERLSDRIYRELERRLKIEKQRLGL